MFESLHPVVRPNPRANLFLIVTLCVITFFSYAPVLKNNFINFDDPEHIIEQPLIKSLSLNNLKKIFSENVNTTYIPLTMLSFAVEYHFFKLKPFIYHLDNLLMHLGVISLIFLFCIELKLNRLTAFTAALLFGLHPMHVESVAWATERKDVLYALFYLLSMLVYLKFLNLERRKVYYVLSWILGLFSMLSKPMAVSLPLVLLLIDFLKGRTDIKRCIMEKALFLLYIVPLAKLTHAQNASAYAIDPNGWHAVQICIWTFSFYIHKFFIPTVYFPFYEVPPPTDFPSGPYWLAIGVLLAWMLALIKYRQNRGIVFGLMFYLCSMFFLLRFGRLINIDAVSDRFMYLPSLGFCLLMAGAVNYLYQKGSLKKFGVIAVSISLSLYLFSFTKHQTQLWRNSHSLWTHVIHQYARSDSRNIFNIDPSIEKAYFYRAQAYAKEKKIGLAIQDFEKIVNSESRSTDKSLFVASAFFNLGNFTSKTNDFNKSIEHYSKAIQLSPRLVSAYQNRGTVFLNLNQPEKALMDFSQAIELNPNMPDLYYNRGTVFGQQNKLDSALNDFNKAIQLDPSNPKYYANRAIVYQLFNQLELAQKDLSTSNSLKRLKNSHSLP